MMNLLLLVTEGITRRIHRSQLYQWLVLVSNWLMGNVPQSTYFANIAALGNYVVPPALKAGTRVWVETVHDYFVWRPGDTSTPDGITIVPAPIVIGAQGRWFRALEAWPGWTQGPNRINFWTVDSVGGNDENVSTLRSWDELRRRFGTNTLHGDPITGVLTVLVSGDHNRVNVDFVIGSECQLYIDGVPSIVATGVLTAYTPRVPATNTPNSMQSAIVPNFAPYAAEPGFLMQGLSGVINNTFAWATLAIAGGCRNTAWENSYTEVTPVGNESFRILRMPRWLGYSIAPQGGGVVTLTEIWLDLVGNDWAGGTTFEWGGAFSGSTAMAFTRCCFSLCTFFGGDYSFDNCKFVGDALFEDCTTGSYYGGAVGHTGAGQFQRIYGHHATNIHWRYFLTQFMHLEASHQSYLRLEDVGVFDAPSTLNAQIQISNFSDLLASTTYGDAPVPGEPYGVFIDANWSHLAGNGTNTVTGATGDLIINATNLAWAATVPYKTDLLNAATDAAGASI